MGTATAPMCQIARSASVHSRRVRDMMAMRSPRPKPAARRPRAIPRTTARVFAADQSTHASPIFCR